MPGSYSIYPTSEDEAIFTKYLIEEQEKYSGVIYIADALNLKRSLLLYQQIKDLGIPVLMVINQVDLAEKEVYIDSKNWSELLGQNILETNAKKNIGIEEIRESIFKDEFSVSDKPYFDIPSENLGLVFKISRQIEEKISIKFGRLLLQILIWAN